MVSNQRKAGVLLSYAGQAVHIISGLLYTPLMIRILGKSEYGLYQLVYSVVSYLSLLSLGFNASYMRFYSREKAKNNYEGIKRLNGMFMLIFLIISLICILAGAVMIYNIRGIFGNGFTEEEYLKARILMILLVINLALTFPNSVFTCIITSQERFIFQRLLILLQSLLNPFIALPLLLLGFGSVGMVCVSTSLTLLTLILNAYYCIKKLDARFAIKGADFSLLREMWIFTFFIFINQIIDQVNWSVDKFLLGRMSGTGSVAVYSVGGQINTLYVLLSSSVSSVFVPKVNKVVAESNDNNELSRIFIKVGRVQFMILMLIVSGFIFFGRDFIGFWVGDGYEDSYIVTLFLIIPVTIPLIQNIGIEIQRAKNMHKVRSIVYLLIAIANIGISIPLIELFGPKGAAFGTAISLLVGNGFFMNWYYHKKIKINIIAFWKNMLDFVLPLVIMVLLGTVSLLFIDYKTLPFLLVGIFIYTIFYCSVMYRMGMNEDEKNIIRKLFSRFAIKSSNR